MTNKYLEKLAVARDESDAVKTFGKSWAAGWVGHGAGMLAGGLGAGLLAAKSPKFGALAARTEARAGKAWAAAKASKPGQFATKHLEGGGAAGAVGAFTGAVIGEDAANYASIRSDIKRQHKEHGQIKMANKYLEKIAKAMDEKELNSQAWRTYGHGYAGSVVGSLVGLGPVANVGARGYKLGKLKGTNKVEWGSGFNSGLHSAAGGIGGAAAGGTVGGGVGAGIAAGLSRLGKGHSGKVGDAAAIGGAVAGTIGAVAGAIKGGQMGTRAHLRKYMAKDKK